ncbi:MAG: EamA family transporter [Patescibacteria group bacterium]
MLGIVFAIGALVFWGFGDFFIQKTTREIGIFKTMFFIGLVAILGLFPFVKTELSIVFQRPETFIILGLAAVVAFLTAIFDFKALKEGKIAVVEPIIGMELPITVILGVTLAHEQLSALQYIIIFAIFIGIVLAITVNHKHLHYHKRIFEKGVVMALFGAIGMALTNFLIGTSSQLVSPLMVIWFIHGMLAVFTFVYLLTSGQFKSLYQNLKKYPKTIITQSVLDNAGWLSFASATTLLPISITTSISESYIILASLLGIYVNREKLKRHQKIGIALAATGIIIMAAITAG